MVAQAMRFPEGYSYSLTERNQMNNFTLLAGVFEGVSSAPAHAIPKSNDLIGGINNILVMNEGGGFAGFGVVGFENLGW